MFLFFIANDTRNILFTTGTELARTGASTFFKDAGEIELVVEPDIASNGSNRHACCTEQQLRLADPLILTPAQHADTQLLTEQVRQARWRQADMLSNAGNIEMAVRQMIANVLTGIAHAVIHRRMQRSVDRLHAPQQ